MKKPEEIKDGLAYLSIKDISQRIEAAKRSAYAYAEDIAADALAYIQWLEELIKSAHIAELPTGKEGDGCMDVPEKRTLKCRLTTDNPKNNAETMLNMLYSVDGWAYIRHGENGMMIQDFVLGMCARSGCEMCAGVLDGTPEEKDVFLSDCVFEICPYADTYAALCGYSAVRSRLKKYEDAGIMPPEREK